MQIADMRDWREATRDLDDAEDLQLFYCPRGLQHPKQVEIELDRITSSAGGRSAIFWFRPAYPAAQRYSLKQLERVFLWACVLLLIGSKLAHWLGWIT